MAVPALKFQPEKPVDERVSRLENNVEHILSDVSEIKVTVLRLDTKIDRTYMTLSDKIDRTHTTLTDKIDGVQTTLSGKIDGLKDVVSNLAVTVANQGAAMEKGFGELRGAISANRAWTLTIIGIAFSAAVSAVAWLLKNIRP